MTMFAEKHDCPTCRCTEPIEVKEPAMTDLDDLIAYAEAHVSCKFDAAILARLVSLRDAGKELPVEPKRWGAEDGGGLVNYSDYDALRAHAVADRAELKFASEQADYWMVQCMNAEAEREAIRDFAIWLTGCGYGFQQHEYFRKNQHLLSKAMTAAMGRDALNELEGKG